MKIRRKQRETRTHAIRWLFLVAILAFCFLAYQGVQGMLHVMKGWTENLPSLETTDAFNFAQDSHMYTADGTTILAEFQLEKRDPVTIEQVSPYVIQGTVDTEDVRFYEHTGVDIAGIGRAVINNLGGGALEGASTITQQLVRNTVLSQEANDISFQRKVREAELAVELEKKYSKDQIIELYLNTINYGDGCYGIEAAAKNYFQISALDLNLTQAATLIGIPQSPTHLDPKTNPEACLTRRNVVLSRMLSAGHITQVDYDAAVLEPLNLNPADAAPQQGIYAYPHFTSYVRNLLLAEDNPYGVSQADLFEGGLSIYTTLDTTIQDQAENACASQQDRMSEELDSALVAIDPTTGYVKAMVGGKDFLTSQVNLATGEGGTGRQAGSSFKAFALAAAIKLGVNPKTMLDCTSPLTVGADTFVNFDGINYGIRSLQSATAVSSNTGYIRLTQQISPNAIMDMAQTTGITSPLNPVLSITLGSSEVTPLEMASAYGTFATNGVKRDPVAITKIVDSDGVVVYQAADTGKQVLSEEVAGAVTKVLRTVFSASDGGTAAGSAPSNGQPVAGKTGTSEDFADHWLVGYAPQLVCSTWIGNPSSRAGTDRSIDCNQLWKDFMSQTLEGQEIKNFPETKDPTYTNSFNTNQQKKYSTTQEETPKSNLQSAPSAVGKTLDEAASLLTGYSAGYVMQYSDSVPANVVISQSTQGDQVVLVVSSGPKPV